MAKDQPIIIKRVKKGSHAHHGGAWKIAYADFVTAMMAFFLLLWLISMTTPEQKKGLADYFAPPNVSQSNSGAGGVLGGTDMDSTGTRMSGSSSSARQDVSSSPDSKEFPAQEAQSGGQDSKSATQFEAPKTSQLDVKSRYNQDFRSAAASLRQAWQALPEIAEIADNLLVEETEDGLSIKIVEQEGRRMFPEGSKFPFDATRKAIAAMAPILQRMPNPITISGHTAAGTIFSNPRYGSWDLSTDRANTVRSILGEFGLSDNHMQSVVGRSSTEPFFQDDPYMPANERVEITLLHIDPALPPDLKP